MPKKRIREVNFGQFLSQNCGRIFRLFLPFSGLKTPLRDRKSPMPNGLVCRISNVYHGLCRGCRFPISRNYRLFRDRMRPKIDRMRQYLCHLRALLCHLRALLCRSVHDTNSDLRRIALDFLTSDIRVGDAESGFVSPRRAGFAMRSAWA